MHAIGQWEAWSMEQESVLFKPLAGELERSSVLGDGADDVIGSAGGDFGFDFQCNLDV